MESSHTDRAFELNQEVISLLKHRLLTAIENYFDRIGPDGQSLRFDQLNLDLSFDSLDHLENGLEEAVLYQLEEIIQPYIGSRAAAEKELQPTIQTEAQSTIDALVYFLEKGRLPWWANANLKENWLHRLEKALVEKPVAVVQKIDPLLVQKERALKRLVYQLPISILEQILDIWLGPKVVEQLQQAIRTIKESKKRPAFTKATPDLYLQVLTEVVASGRTMEQQLQSLQQLEQEVITLPGMSADVASDQVAESVWQESFFKNGPDQQVAAFFALLEKKAQAGQEYKEGVAGIQPLPKVLVTLKEAYAEIDRTRTVERIDRFLHAVQELTSHPDQAIAREAAQLVADLEKWVTAKEKQMEAKSKKTTEVKPQKTSSAEEMPEALFVENAGLVILHPFLLHFFKAFDLCDGHAFKDETSQEMAIHLLHHLATGATEPAEHELSFNKLLCNWPLEEPVNRFVPLTEKMQEESTKLLQSVITHWNKLGNTTPAGLRGSFLYRAGKLTKKDNGWKLIVEKKAQDILLDFLPWGIGVVRLPWMEVPVFVEWQ